jgi:tripartite-type tricarboxylate transporter receptor subunit TctC
LVNTTCVALAVALLLVCGSASLLQAQPVAQPPTSQGAVAEFYKGKQIVLTAGVAVGGGYDLLARLMARHLGKHIPGNPHIVVQNMPAANSLAAANVLYNALPKDGTHIGLLIRNMLMMPVSKLPGARFEVEKFNWIGSLASETAVAFAWHTAPVKSFGDLSQRDLVVGGMTAVDPVTTPRLYNALIGTRFKIVNGYKGTTDIGIAMERGEVEGIGDWSWNSLKALRSDWLRDKKINLLLQGALTREPELADVPFALDYVTSDLDREVMMLYFAQKVAARPVVAPPDIPADRLEALRTAFMRMAGDPEFNDDATKSQLQVNLTSGESVQRIASMIASTREQVATRLLAVLSPSGR